MPKGGRRFNAGRPKGTGKYNEPTKVLRVPESRLFAVKAFLLGQPLTMPLYEPHNLKAPAVELNLHETTLANLNEPVLLQLTEAIDFPTDEFRLGDKLIIEPEASPSADDWVLSTDAPLRLEKRGRKLNPIWGVVVGVVRRLK